MRKRPIAERLMEKVDKSDTGCWLWTAALRPGGYGGIQVGRRNRLAHRIAYELFVGPIPDGLELDHLCRVRRCCNPQHLEAVTRLENIARSSHAAASVLRTGKCQRGHLFEGPNVYVSPRGRRACRTCKQVAQARANAKRYERAV